MKIYLFLVFILAVITLKVSAENQLEASLTSEMLNNSKLSDDLIISKLETALQSMDTSVQKTAIYELGMYVNHLHKSRLNTEGNRNTKRSIFKSRRSRDSLISYFNTKHAQSGYDLSKRIELDTMPKIQQALSEFRDENEPGIQYEQLDVDALSERVESSISPWVRVPMILATLWPDDPEVLEFLWHFKKSDVNIKPDFMLRLLNTGKFDTMDVNKYRMKQLVSFVGYQENIYTAEVVALAARGLALSHPEEAIPDLIHAGLDQIKPRADILITLSGYSDEQLDPYFARLVPLVFASIEEIPDKAKLDKALARLKPYASQPHESLPTVPLRPAEEF